MKIRFNKAVFGAMVENKRNWEGLGMRAAAEQIGISAATLSRIENGKLPDLITCKMICDWIHVDINYFFNQKG